MLHRPTRLLFEIYLRAAADPSRLTMFDLSARLAHVCDVPEWAAGRWCDVFEIRDWKIQRVFIYLDPDYAGKDTARYPWLSQS